MGLRVKLAVSLLVFVVFAVVVYGATTLRTEEQIYLRETENRAVTLLRSFAIPCGVAMASNDMVTLDNYVVKFAEAASSHDLRYMAVLDFKGRVTSHTTSGEFGKVYDDPFTLSALESDNYVKRRLVSNGEDILEVAVPVKNQLRWGTIRAGFTLSGVEHAVAERRTRVYVFAVVIVSLVGLVAFLVLQHIVVKPVLLMQRMAEQVRHGELKSRVVLPQKDEMGQLAIALNAMAQQIEDYTGGLEKKVEERTHELAKANEQLVAANQQLERLAKTDPLTGLYNRRQFMEQLDFEIRRGARTPHQFALILLDVDYFKSYNDTHGHSAGDELLQRMAALLQLNLRGTDVVARYGGEEFVVLLLDTGADEGFATARKLQQVVDAQPFPREETQPEGKLTISVGVSFYPGDSRDGRKLIDYADRALYKSKDRGRNSVTRWADMPET
ncbi:MAG: diguanylate cyclase [Clostridia bacterium]|nr:diguanylate cyclase [Deltaproteobacteria bacterium]